MLTSRIVHVSSIVAGEYHENEIRKSFVPGERVHIGRALKALMLERRGRPVAENRDNRPTLEAGRTRDVIAKKVGFSSGKTYERAEAIVEAAEKEPEKYQPLVEEMNRTGRVDGAHRKLVKAQKAEAINQEPPPLSQHSINISHSAFYSRRAVFRLITQGCYGKAKRF